MSEYLRVLRLVGDALRAEQVYCVLHGRVFRDDRGLCPYCHNRRP